MRFSAKFPDPRKTLSGTEVQIARSVTAGMRQITSGLKEELRSDVTSAGLGQRLANTWRGKTYPETGESVEATTYVYSNAAKLIDAFDRGVTIRASGRKYLAIPTPDAGVKHASVSKGSARITPAAWEKETGIKLRFVPSRTGGVLVADARYQRQPVRMQRRKSFAPIKGSGPDQGRRFVVIFVLVSQVKLRKRFDIEATAQAWAAQVSGAIAANWET